MGNLLTLVENNCSCFASMGRVLTLVGNNFFCFAGMGDVLTLVEKAEESIKADEADEMTKRIMQQKFDFNDFLKQSQMMSGMGGMGNLTKMLPGLHTWTHGLHTWTTCHGHMDCTHGLPVMLFLCRTFWHLMSLCLMILLLCCLFCIHGFCLCCCHTLHVHRRDRLQNSRLDYLV